MLGRQHGVPAGIRYQYLYTLETGTLSQTTEPHGLKRKALLQGRTEEELLAFIAPQLEAREPFYAKANHILDVDICDEDSDERIAEELYQFLKN